MSREIQLTQGKVTIVDDELYEQLLAIGSWYYDARQNVAVHNKQYMQRVVCNLAGKCMGSRVFHRDGNRLNNQLANLLSNIEDRLWSRVIVGDVGECWEWQGHTNADGYGRLRANGKEVFVHRLAFEYGHGQDPGELCVLHSCDNPACCNPNHLLLGTRADNNRDRVIKGRSADSSGERNGHSILTDEAVRYIRQSSETGTSLSKKYGVHESLISRVRLGKCWKHVA